MFSDTEGSEHAANDSPGYEEITRLKPQPLEASKAAQELMKQLITLSSGVLALSGTFIE
jgi:hypothetical protein